MGKEELDNFVSGLDAMRRERLERSLSNADMKQSEIDWEQRRYEIAKEMLPYVSETTRSILMSGHSLGDDAKGKTLAEFCVLSAISFADALISELKKGVEK